MSPAIDRSDGHAPLRVLVVDDSAVAREVLAMVLRRDGIDVEIASSGQIALQRIAARAPHVVLLDLEMPGMSGLELLDRIVRDTPIPVVVCSGIAQPGAAAAIRALELGAVDVIPKPAGGIRAIMESEDLCLAAIVRAAASARTRRLGTRSAPPTIPVALGAAAAARRAHSVVVMGASTGGTEALRVILSCLPAGAPPIVVVQHMPAAYTNAFAQRLDALCAIEVREARQGDALRPGLALIAPGGRQLELSRVGVALRVRVFDGAPVSGHRPSVDVLFHSAARHAGSAAVAVLLTGMGNDGARGLLHLRERGAHTIAQDEATCVVFGMPGEAIALGAAAEVVPLEHVPSAILSAASRRTDAPALLHSHS